MSAWTITAACSALITPSESARWVAVRCSKPLASLILRWATTWSVRAICAAHCPVFAAPVEVATRARSADASTRISIAARRAFARANDASSAA